MGNKNGKSIKNRSLMRGSEEAAHHATEKNLFWPINQAIYLCICGLSVLAIAHKVFDS